MEYLVKDVVHYCNVLGNSNSQIKNYAVNYYDLTFVISGKLIYTVGNKKYVLKNGDALFLPPNTKRSREAGNKPIHYISFNFSLNKDLKFNSYLLKNVINREIISLVCTYPFSHLSELYNSKEKCMSILNYLLYEILNATKDECNNEHIAKILKYVNENINKKLSLSTAAKEVNLSKQYLAFLFKQELNTTFTAYVNDQRFMLARDLIINSDMKLEEIATNVGFENYNYFSRLFKEKFSETAVKLKNTARKKEVSR